MSLLDDVSIVVTPNGYKAGELYAVVPVPSYGSEQVTNGDFATDTDWTKGTGWTISGNAANFTYSIPSSLTQDLNVTSGLRYLIEYEIISNSGISLKGGGSNFFNVGSSIPSTVGLHSFSVTAVNSSGIEFRYLSGSGSLSIQNISIKEVLVPSADMDVTRATAATRVDEAGLVNYAEILGSELVADGNFPTGTSEWGTGTGVTVGGGVATFTSTPSGQSVSQNTVATALPNGSLAKVSFEVLSRTEGSFGLYFSGTLVGSRSSVGVFTAYFTKGTETSFYIRALGTTSGTISNVSVIEETRDNVPRIDYSGGGCPHILAEPQRTNLFTYSEDFSQWTNINSTDTANYSTAPDGDNTATRLLTTSQDSSYLYINSLTISDSTAYTMSIYVKSNGNGLDDFRLYTTTGGTSANLTATTEWQRFDYNLTSTTTWTNIGIRGVGGQETDVLVWGAQMEEGSYQTSLIPTSGSTVTRNQDQFTRDGIGSLINSEEGVLFVEAATTFDSSTSRRITLSDGSTSNRVSLEFDDSVENKIKAFISLDGSSQILNYTATDLSQFNKIAIKWKVNDFAIWFNGVEVATDSFGSTPVGLNQVSFGDGANGNTFYGKVKQLQVYKTALTDTQLAALTS